MLLIIIELSSFLEYLLQFIANEKVFVYFASVSELDRKSTSRFHINFNLRRNIIVIKKLMYIVILEILCANTIDLFEVISNSIIRD